MSSRKTKKKEKDSKEITQELKIGLRPYFMRKEFEKHEWYPRTVYASKHTKEEYMNFSSWEELFKKY